MTGFNFNFGISSLVNGLTQAVMILLVTIILLSWPGGLYPG